MFRVQGATRSGPWGEPGVALRIKILPSWWSTRPFQAAVGLRPSWRAGMPFYAYARLSGSQRPGSSVCGCRPGTFGSCYFERRQPCSLGDRRRTAARFCETLSAMRALKRLKLRFGATHRNSASGSAMTESELTQRYSMKARAMDIGASLESANAQSWRELNWIFGARWGRAR